MPYEIVRCRRCDNSWACRPALGGVFYRTLSHTHSYRTLCRLAGLRDFCPALRSADFSRCGLLTDAGVAALASGCPELERLELAGCVGITDSGLAAVVDLCKKPFTHNGRNLLTIY